MGLACSVVLTMWWLILPITVWAGCPFQNPFFFVDRPSVLTVVDSDGEMVADRSEKQEVDDLEENIENIAECE